MEMKFSMVLDAGVKHMELTAKPTFIGVQPLHAYDEKSGAYTESITGYKYSLNFGDYGILDVKVLGDRLEIPLYSYVKIEGLRIGEYKGHLWARAETLKQVQIKRS